MKHFNLLLISSLSLLFSSCATRKEQSNSLQQTDSLFVRERLKQTTIRMPREEARLAIPTAKLQTDKPLQIRQQSGRATATVRFTTDTLYITASCDSLQALVEEYEREMGAMRNVESVQQVKRERSGCRWGWIGGLIVGMVGIVLIMRKGGG